jgi:hypothetical protein
MTLYQVFPMERFQKSLEMLNDEDKFQKSFEKLNDEEHFHKSLEKSNFEEKETNENENVAIPNSTSKNSIISLT